MLIKISLDHLTFDEEIETNQFYFRCQRFTKLIEDTIQKCIQVVFFKDC